MTISHARKKLPELLDIAEVARHLNVNVRHVRRLVAERRIPFIKWGHLIRFDPDEVNAWLDGNARHVEAITPSAYRGAIAPASDSRRGRLSNPSQIA